MRLVCENHPTKAWPEECDCGPGMNDPVPNMAIALALTIRPECDHVSDVRMQAGARAALEAYHTAVGSSPSYRNGKKS